MHDNPSKLPEIESTYVHNNEKGNSADAGGTTVVFLNPERVPKEDFGRGYLSNATTAGASFQGIKNGNHEFQYQSCETQVDWALESKKGALSYQA